MKKLCFLLLCVLISLPAFAEGYTVSLVSETVKTRTVYEEYRVYVPGTTGYRSVRGGYSYEGESGHYETRRRPVRQQYTESYNAPYELYRDGNLVLKGTTPVNINKLSWGENYTVYYYSYAQNSWKSFNFTNASGKTYNLY